MRMWLVEPHIMCRNHLLGEHRELHTFTGTLKKRISVDGYMQLGLLDPDKLSSRHEELVAEMLRRGYGHYSPIEVPDYSYVHEKSCIDVEKNLQELLSREDTACSKPSCKELYEKWCLENFPPFWQLYENHNIVELSKGLNECRHIGDNDTTINVNEPVDLSKGYIRICDAD